jgi:predicted dehydrogenase
MTRDTSLRWGILGVARINQRLLPAFALAKHGQLRAIASRSPSRAREAADRAGIPTAYGSYDELLADPDIDAVYIPLPNALHGEWTRRAAERGKHILCEKPLTPTAPEAEELVAYCAARKVKLMDGFMWPHHPRTARLHQVIDSGVIGEVQRVSGSLTFLLPLDSKNIRLDAGLAGGSLLDAGCYPVYGIRWAMGAEPVRVWATASYEHEVDVEMSGIVWLEDGRLGTFDCGFTLPLRSGLEIIGTKGVLRVPQMWNPPPRATFTIQRDDQSVEEVAIEGENQIVRMLDHFNRCVLDDQPIQPSPSEAVKTLRVLDALARAAREERVVDM